MKIHAIPFGEVTLKRAFLHARTGPRRRLDLLLPGPWCEPVPIRGWLIEHESERILIDMGDLATAKDAPFARHRITADDELPRALERTAGITCAEVTTALVTHLHPDHFRGAQLLGAPVQVAEGELRELLSWRGKLQQKITGVPVPGGIDFRPVPLGDGPFGAFAAHRKLTADGRVLLVATPGHTRNHCSVIALDDAGRHVMLAGDTTDTLEQLLARRADPIAPDPAQQIATIDLIAAHGRQHPTVYLPTHDHASVKRLEAGETL